MPFEPLWMFAAFSIIAGILVCFWGYRIFKLVLGLAGFLAGAWLFYMVGMHFTGRPGVLTIILTIFGGLIGASLSVFFYYIGLFLVGALGGWHLGMLIAGATWTALVLAVPIALAVVGGILAIFFQKLVVVVSTAFFGAWGIVAGGFYFLGSGLFPADLFMRPVPALESLRAMNPLFVLVWFALAAAGLVYQYRYPGRYAAGGPARDGS